MPYIPPFPPYQRQPYTPPPYLKPSPATPPQGEQGLAQPPQQSGFPPIIKPSLYDIPIVAHSRIDLAQFVNYKLNPPTPPSIPDIPRMQYSFRPFEDGDDNVLRMDIVLSREERAYVIHQGHYDDEIDNEQLFGPKEMADLQIAQESELAFAQDSHTHAALTLEHKQQLEFARTQKLPLTIEYYLAFPFERRFTTRREAAQYQDQLRRKVISKIQGWLKAYHNEELD